MPRIKEINQRHKINQSIRPEANVTNKTTTSHPVWWKISGTCGHPNSPKLKTPLQTNNFTISVGPIPLNGWAFDCPRGLNSDQLKWFLKILDLWRYWGDCRCRSSSLCLIIQETLWTVGLIIQETLWTMGSSTAKHKTHVNGLNDIWYHQDQVILGIPPKEAKAAHVIEVWTQGGRESSGLKFPPPDLLLTQNTIGNIPFH